jgi:hypothetical protein
MSDLGSISYYLGIKVERDRAQKNNSQSAGILGTGLGDYECSTRASRFHTKYPKWTSDAEVTRAESHQYLHIIGKLMYAKPAPALLSRSHTLHRSLKILATSIELLSSIW